MKRIGIYKIRPMPYPGKTAIIILPNYATMKLNKMSISTHCLPHFFK